MNLLTVTTAELITAADLVSEGSDLHGVREVGEESGSQHKQDGSGGQEAEEQWTVLSQTSHEWMTLPGWGESEKELSFSWLIMAYILYELSLPYS